MATLALSTLDSTTLLAGVVCVLSVVWWLSTRRPSGLPPGPGPALPVLGHLHLVSSDPRATFRAWRRQYGDVFSLYMGGRLVVVLNGLPVIKEALVKMADVFSHRPHMFITDRISEGKGVVSTSGPVWKENRKTALEILRDLGMGKNVLADRIQGEITHYIRAIEDHQGAPMDLSHLTTVSVSNNICGIIFGKRFEYDDPLFMEYLRRANQNLRCLNGSAAVNFFPFLDKLPGDAFNVKKVLSNVRFVEESLLIPQVETHQRQHNDHTAPDFIHAYLTQMNKQRDSGKDTSLSERDLVISTGDLFLAGTETTSTALAWTLLFFLHHPEVQDKCFKELCDVIGTGRPPSMQDKPEMTYLEATTMEVLRRADIAPFAVQHSTASDVTLRGYVIPKDTMIVPNLDSVLQDQEAWGDPHNFRPERFIGLDGKIVRPEEFIPFSIGRRVCLGESLARMELFLYLSTLIQRFRFLPPEGEPLPSLEGTLGITYTPKPYKIRAVSRE